MNIAKVKNSAAFVNYVKPGMEMVDLEIEGSLLLTASDPSEGRVAASGFGNGANSPIKNGATMNARPR